MSRFETTVTALTVRTKSIGYEACPYGFPFKRTYERLVLTEHSANARVPPGPGPAPDLSVVVPVAAGDLAWRGLLEELGPLPSGVELILCAPPATLEEIRRVGAGDGTLLCPGNGQRAAQLNTGARQAQGEWLCFLHCDTRPGQGFLQTLMHETRDTVESLVYCDLGFLTDGPALTGLNAWGAGWRSRWLGLPFGDQALTLRRRTWHNLGGFREDLAYGEDHVFVWQARRHGLRLQRLNYRVYTSARKYREGGWGRTTVHHTWLTLRQAVPQMLGLMGDRLVRRRSARREHSL